MPNIPSHPRTLVAAGLVTLALLLPRSPCDAQARAADTARKALPTIPGSLREEHAAIHTELMHATSVRGRVGVAARALAKLLQPHFEREEQIALPPLGLVAPLARGEPAQATRVVLAMTDSLRAELPRMLAEHDTIRVATRRLGEVARAAGNVRVARLAHELALHARTEEELLYPMAILVGDLVRLRPSAAQRR
jgi:hypothetical protein